VLAGSLGGGADRRRGDFVQLFRLVRHEPPICHTAAAGR
jgi:hypothetical protein